MTLVPTESPGRGLGAQAPQSNSWVGRAGHGAPQDPPSWAPHGLWVKVGPGCVEQCSGSPHPEAHPWDTRGEVARVRDAGWRRRQARCLRDVPHGCPAHRYHSPKCSHPSPGASRAGSLRPLPGSLPPDLRGPPSPRPAGPTPAFGHAPGQLYLRWARQGRQPQDHWLPGPAEETTRATGRAESAQPQSGRRGDPGGLQREPLPRSPPGPHRPFKGTHLRPYGHVTYTSRTTQPTYVRTGTHSAAQPGSSVATHLRDHALTHALTGH